MNSRTILLSLGLLGAGCGHVTRPPLTGTTELDHDSGKVCAAHCDTIGMRLAAVVIMSDRTGCVCEPRDGTTARASAAASFVQQVPDEEQERARHRRSKH